MVMFYVCKIQVSLPTWLLFCYLNLKESFITKIFTMVVNFSSKQFTKKWNFDKGRLTFVYCVPDALQMPSHLIFTKVPDSVISIIIPTLSVRKQRFWNINETFTDLQSVTNWRQILIPNLTDSKPFCHHPHKVSKKCKTLPLM